MMSLEVRPREQQSSSANYNYFDGDKIREALVLLYLNTISINKNIPDQLRSLNTKHGKSWWRVIENTIALLSSYEEGYDSVRNSNRTITNVINSVKGNITGAFKYDLAQAIVAIQVSLQFNSSPIPLYIEDINKINDKVFSFYSTVYSSGFKGIIRPSLYERTKALQDSQKDTGDIEQLQQIMVTDTLHKIPTVKTLKDNFKVLLCYIGSIQESLSLIHQTTKDRRDKVEKPYSRYYTYEEIYKANGDRLVFSPDGKDYLIVPRYSVYRVLLVAWICDIMKYQEYAAEGLYLDFIGAGIYRNSGYFTKIVIKDDRFKTFLSDLMPSSDYVTMIEATNDELVTQNMFKKAFLETKKYCAELSANGHDVTIDIENYNGDHMSVFRDFFTLLSNCDIAGENYNVIKVSGEDDDALNTNAMGLVISVLGTEYSNTQIGGFNNSIQRVKFNNHVPLAVDIPEAKYEMLFWKDLNTIEEWFETEVKVVVPPTGYNIPYYEAGDYNSRQLVPLVRNIDESFCRAVLLDNGRGKYTEMTVQSIYMAYHLDILQSFFRADSQGDSLLRKVARQRREEIEEYIIYKDLVPRKITPNRVTELPLNRRINTAFNTVGDYRFSLFQSPVEDLKKISNGIHKVLDTDFKDVISDILVLAHGNDYSSLLQYCLHSAKSPSKLYTHVKRYAHELLRRYIKFLFVAWEVNNWNFVAQYGDEDTMFNKLVGTLRFEPMKANLQSIRILHLLSKPLIINSSIGELYSDYGVIYVASGSDMQLSHSSRVSIMTPQKNNVELLLAQVPDRLNSGQSYTILLSPNKINDGGEMEYVIVFPATQSPEEVFGTVKELLPRELRREDVIYIDRTLDAVIDKRGVKV